MVRLCARETPEEQESQIIAEIDRVQAAQQQYLSGATSQEKLTLPNSIISSKATNGHQLIK